MASPQLTMAIFFVILLASSSPCLARARLMILSDHLAQPNTKSSGTNTATSTAASSTRTTTTTTSPQQSLVQGVAVSSPTRAPATGEVGIDHPESNGWIPDGSVPSPGVGHHP
ncbi:unnamed protein product [Urochloa humidicola]